MNSRAVPLQSHETPVMCSDPVILSRLLGSYEMVGASFDVLLIVDALFLRYRL
jgi:hypothetical protein